MLRPRALVDNGVNCWGGDSQITNNIPRAQQSLMRILVQSSTACALDDTGAHCWGDNANIANVANLAALSNPQQIAGRG